MLLAGHHVLTFSTVRLERSCTQYTTALTRWHPPLREIPCRSVIHLCIGPNSILSVLHMLGSSMAFLHDPACHISRHQPVCSTGVQVVDVEKQEITARATEFSEQCELVCFAPVGAAESDWGNELIAGAVHGSG